ncbi:MAG: hypothetical protein HUJ69_01835 [Lachnospiraceae bacterium]|nr:hypothetical protein [Lachnospiraceae bacterium]
MSRKKQDYEHSFLYHFRQWVAGNVDPLEGTMEIRVPQKKAAETVAPDLKQIRTVYDPSKNKELKRFNRLYKASSLLLVLLLMGVLIWAMGFMPEIGAEAAPAHNATAGRYVEKGLEETGAVNFVTGMILDYRAFDTFGESCVLFIATICVQILLRVDKDSSWRKGRKTEEAEDSFRPGEDVVLQKVSTVLVPLIFIFGIYVILNGHLSPGGGFSGGAIVGAGLILYVNAFGFEKTERFFTGKTFKIITVASLSFYALAKTYSFYTGANHLPTGIPLGVPGAILSSGLILPLNICVGMVVACTMYAFYALFRKGGF